MSSPQHLSAEQAARMRTALLTYARELFGDQAVDANRWQTSMSEYLSQGGKRLVAQQSISKLMRTDGTMSVGLARAILCRLGEDPDEVLTEGAAQDMGDMNHPRARVLLRVQSLFPDDVIREIRAMSLDSREGWDELDWLTELMTTLQRRSRTRRRPTEKK